MNFAHKSKCLLFTVATGSQEYYEITLPRLAKIADLMECDFRWVNRGPRPPSAWDTWLRFWVPSALPDYEHYICLDPDILANPITLKISDLATLMRGDKLKIAIDEPWGKVGRKKYVAWCERHLGQKVNSGEPYYNGGVWSIPRNIAEEITKKLPALDTLPNEHPNDQQWLNCFIQQQNIAVKVLPRSMNWMEPDPVKAVAKAKLLHFATPARKRQIPIFARKLDELSGNKNVFTKFALIPACQLTIGV